MATFSTIVKLGDAPIKIESSNFLELFEAIASVQELSEATENEDVRLVVRPLKSDRRTFKKYSYRRIEDGALLDLGMSQDQDRLIPLFPYSKYSSDYKGFRTFAQGNDEDSEKIQNESSFDKKRFQKQNGQ